MIERGRTDGSNCGDNNGDNSPKQPCGSFLGKGTSTGRHALLRPQEWRFLLRVQVEQASVVKVFARRTVGRGVQLFLDGGTASSRHQARSVVVGTAEQIHYNFFTVREIEK